MSAPTVEGMGDCPVCFALVREERADDHADWHDGGRGRLLRVGRRLVPHLPGVSVAAVGRERDTGVWMLLLGMDPGQSHFRALKQVQVAEQEGTPISLDEVMVTEAVTVRWAASIGKVTIGDFKFTDAVPVHVEESS